MAPSKRKPAREKTELSFAPPLAELRLAIALGGEHAIHNLLQVAREGQILHVGPADVLDDEFAAWFGNHST